MKRATKYLEEDLHKALKLKAIESEASLSEIVNEAVRSTPAEDPRPPGSIKLSGKEYYRIRQGLGIGEMFLNDGRFPSFAEPLQAFLNL
jgi:hypothetical protein